MSEQILFPKAVLSVNREEYYQETDGSNSDAHQPPLQLTVKEKLTNDTTTLPTELQGSVFIIAPVGSVSSPAAAGTVGGSSSNSHQTKVVLPAKDGWTSLLNGDGMMYRLDFNNGQAIWSSRFVNTPSRYADRIAEQKYPRLKFIDLEVARLSLSLGQCFQVNTAFLPLKFPQAQNARLLATWDAGMPYEIDPDSLKVIAPVGELKNWSPLIKTPIVFPFEQLMASAHPAFDPNTGEMFGANVVRSLNTLLWISRLFPYDAHKWVETLPNFIQPIAQFLVNILTVILTFLVRAVTSFLELLGIGSKDALYLIRWDGSASLQKWKVVLPNRRPVKIRQTVHQMGISEKYIVLADTSFKIVLEDLIPAVNPAALSPEKEEVLLAATEAKIDEKKKAEIKIKLDLLRDYLSYPQFPDTYLYIIDRAQLQNLEPEKAVTAKRVKIKREFSHFLTDYDNPNDRITIHAALNTATDAAEFIHSDDDSVYQLDAELRGMAGMLNDALAVNRAGFYEIDGKEGKLKREELLDLEQAMKNTWYLALYAYRDEQPTKQFNEIYWMSFGAWTNTLSEFVLEMYKNYKYREEPLQTLLKKTREGVPVTLSRMTIDRNPVKGKKVLNIVDSYHFPKGYFASSPQFVPKNDKEGYIVCPVIHSDNFFSDSGINGTDWSDNSEIWIFDADKLSAGPQYRLSHPQLNLGFTLHTTWLSEAAAAPTREYDIQEDFHASVEACTRWHSQAVAEEIEELFAQVYAEFNRDRKST